MQIDTQNKPIQRQKPPIRTMSSRPQKHIWRSALPLSLSFLMFTIGCGTEKPSKSKSGERATAAKSTANQGANAKTASDNKSQPNTIASKSKSATQPIDSKTPSSNKTAAQNPTTPFVKPPPKPPIQQVYRPNDDRPKHDDARLASFGVRRFESKRLVLYTDIPAEVAKGLIGVVDPLYPAWLDYFGPLPPARDGSEFQVTGYIMTDRDKFKRLGLIPGDLRPFINGRHRRYEFWMLDQKTDYYRRHLILHEATHCFMTILEHESNVPEVWYLEGMAELFATHQFDESGKAHFRVMPKDKTKFRGLGRIRIVQDAVAEDRAFTLSRVLSMRSTEFLKNEPYAWSWAICQFFDKHPRYRERFEQLGRFTSRRAFQQAFQERFGAELPTIDTEWRLFVLSLDDGHDIARAAIEFKPGQTLNASLPTIDSAVAADRGWQTSGVMVEKGRTYSITASGRITLADKPKPWVCEPQGITFRYFDGQPLGRVIACIHANDASGLGSMLKTIPIGRFAKFTAPTTGTLYLRANDAWNDLANNRGKFTVTVSAAQ